MPGPTTEVLSTDMKDLREDVHKLAVGLAEVRTQVGAARWVLGLLLASMLGAIASGIWWAASITSDVRHLESELGKMDARFDRLDAKLDAQADEIRKAKSQAQ